MTIKGLITRFAGQSPAIQAGAASGISETGAELGGALSIAVLGTLGIAIYRSEVGDGIPEGLPAEDAAAAEDSIGGAVAVAEGLAEPLSTQLLSVAADAFTLGLQTAALASAVVAGAAAVFTAVFMRGLRPASKPESQSHSPMESPPVTASEPHS